MIERYKHTFIGTQTIIAAVTLAILYKLQVWQVAAVFFATMQLGAVMGAMWAARLKRKLEEHQRTLALD
jgi:uncharacterized membrane protein YfcA